MKALFWFTLGFMLAIVTLTYAQSGSVMDQYGNQYQFHQFPGGATQYWGPNGQSGTIYQMPPMNKPC